MSENVGRPAEVTVPAPVMSEDEEDIDKDTLGRKVEIPLVVISTQLCRR